MKKLFLITVFFIAFLQLHSQTKQLLVKKNDKGLYIDHKVMAKEGLYAIGRLYNVHPKHIASFNNMDMNKGLDIGQLIHIPLTDTNFTQKENKGTPVYYTVGNSDGLQKISNQNNKVSLQNLRNWNGLKGDNINAGSNLIVGFLLSKEMPAVAVNKPVEKEPAVTVKEEKPLVKNDPPKQETVPVKKEEAPVAAVIKEQEAPLKEEPSNKEPVFAKEKNTTAEAQGFFKPYFDQQVKATPASKNEMMTAGIFKTTSGWQDAKYYLLIDGVATGSIVKLVNPDNDKAVYAKVLGEMNGIRQNQGLGVRISNAAAAALGVADMEKFIVRVNY